jgi:hypothetical protein
LTTLELLSPNSFPVPSQQTTMFLGIGNLPKLGMAHHLDETKCYSTGSGDQCWVTQYCFTEFVHRCRILGPYEEKTEERQL